MKDEPTLDPWTDPEAEARIVALLLGEASDFERAELERLMAEQPELAVFHRRMTVISQLVGEAESKPTPSQQAAWWLATERREKLLARLGLPSATKANATNPAAKRPLVRHSILIAAGLAACLAVVATIATPMVGKRREKSQAVVIAAQARREAYEAEGGKLREQSTEETAASDAFNRQSRAIALGNVDTTWEASPEASSSPASASLPAPVVTAPSVLNFAIVPSGDRDNTAARRNAISAVESAPPTEPQLAQVELQRDNRDRAKNLSVADSFGANVDGFADMKEFAGQADGKPGARWVWDATDGKDLSATGTPPSASKPASRPEVRFAEDDGRGSQVAQQAVSSEFGRNEALAQAAQQSDFQIGANFTSVDNLFGYVEAKEKEFGSTAPAQPSSGVSSKVRVESKFVEVTEDRLRNFGFGGGELGGSAKDDAKENQADDSLALNKESALGLAPAQPGGGSAVPADRASGVSPEARNFASSAPTPPPAAMREIRAFQQTSTKQLADLPEVVEFEGFVNHAPSPPLGEQPTNSSEALLADANLGLGSFRQLDREAMADQDSDGEAPETLARSLAESTPSKAKAAVPVGKKEIKELAQLQAKENDAVDEAEGSQELEKLAKVQESKVEEARLKMLDTSERYRITDLAALSNNPSISGDPVTGAGSILQKSMLDRYDTETAIAQVKTQIDTLKNLSGEEMIKTAAMLDLKDQTLTEFYPQWNKLKLDREALKQSGLEANHPKVKTTTTQISQLENLLNDAVTNAKTALETKYEMAEKAMKTAADSQNEGIDKTQAERRKYAEYSEASKEYELQKNMLVHMQAKLAEISAKEAVPAAQPPPPPTQEIQASAEPFSTFSLHVSDVSFKLAHTALVEKGEWPAAEKIRAEEFVNAFDYRDPTPAYAEKVACRLEQAAHPFLPQRNSLRVALRTACDGRAGSQALRLTLLVDTSGSMQREDRHATMVRVLESLAGQLTAQDSVSLIGFARTPSLLADRVPGDQAKGLADLVARTPSDGGTNLELALQMAEEIALRQMVAGQQNRVILFTDGAANLGDANPESLHARIAALRQKGLAFDACGVGLETLNDAVLEALTRGGDGRYYALNRPEDAEAGFAKKLAGALRPAARNVKVQVRFNPQRVGAYRLVGFEKHRLNKEDFRNDAVDAAEMSAEEAGVALYQVQARPDGTGDVGEVSVRFQDTASGLMIERAWVIPYEASAPAFDQATASLQLAATAGHFAERLRGNEGVPFDPFVPALAKIREHYTSDERVGQLTAMFEKARGLAR